MREVILEPKRVAETKGYVFPFTLPSGVTVSTQSVAVSVHSGSDLTPATTSGSASASGPSVSQKIAGGVAGVIYWLLATITTSDSQTLQMGGFLSITP